MGPMQRWMRRLVHAQFARLEDDQVDFQEGSELVCHGCVCSEDSLRATLVVRNPETYRAIALRGVTGAAEAYMAGYWSADDLTTLVRIVARNPQVFAGLNGGLARTAQAGLRAFHALRRNTRLGSRRNIHAHYDLGNEFFSLFLDPTLTYSSGIFERRDASLEEASFAKYDRACRKLELCAEDHVLEIGSGWGGFALYAASRYGCRVTSVTVSQEQYELARRRIADAGLSDRVEVRLQDYREVPGTFDKLISIEMIEAVGHRFFDQYFRVCSERLKPAGLMLLQAITTREQHYDSSIRTVDFVKRYIFPGGQLPSVGAICDSIKSATDLRMLHLEDFSAHYARTLAAWRESMFKNLDQIRELGLPDTFIRMWEFYLCYCEGGFAERVTGVAQILFEKPRGRRDPVLGGLA
jgi:cyclopropane-fatty-acyl-phospholipid synthase